MSAETIGDRLASHPNAFNLVRLVLALEVLAWHAYSLRGDVLSDRWSWLWADVGVDTFLAISGFLVTAAWLRRPRLRTFWEARARRILPGLWACLLATAFAIVPFAVTVRGGDGPSWSTSFRYVVRNAGVVATQWDIPGTTDSLHVHAWNGSLWSLIWEVGCYAVLAALGLASLVRVRPLVVLVSVVWALTCALQLLGVSPYDGSIYLWMPLRALLMFGMGALAYVARHHIPFDRRLALLMATTVVLGVLLSDNYRVVAAPGVVYLAVWAALRLGSRPKAVLRMDVSYGVYIYGFPIQQALLLMGWSRGWGPFVLVSALTVVPAAVLSWVVVERRFLSVRRSASAPVALTVAAR